MKKWMYALCTVVLFLSLTLPVLADDGQGLVVYPGSNVVIGPGEEIEDDVAVLGGNLELREGGTIHGSLIALGGNVILDGLVDRDVVAVGGNLELQSHAVVGGDLVTFGANLSRADEAVVRGQRIEGLRGVFPTLRLWPTPVLPGLRPVLRPWRMGDYSTWFGSFMNFAFNVLAMMVLGVLLVSLLPKQTALVGKTVHIAPLPCLGIGLLTMLALPFVLLLLVILCIGIPVAILLALLAIAAGLFGWVAIAAILGQRILAALKTQPSPLLEVIIGVGALALLSAVPCLGWLLALFVAAMGLGAVVLTRFGTMPYELQREPVSPPQPPVPPELEIPSVVEERPPEPTPPEVPTPPEAPGAPEEQAPSA